MGYALQGLVIQGEDVVRFLDVVNGRTKPSGSDFAAARAAIACAAIKQSKASAIPAKTSIG